MTRGPMGVFHDMISCADAAGIVEYLRGAFADDCNAAQFESLAQFVCRDINVLPSALVVGPHDKPFVALMKQIASSADMGATSSMPSLIELGTELDFLDPISKPEDLSALQMLSFAMLNRIVPTRQVAVVMMARDEGIYLPEWLAHHRLLGAEHFFVYTNDNSDGSDQLLREFASDGLITLIENSFAHGVNPQRKNYQHALSLLEALRDFRWVLFIDADEFLNFGDDEPGALLSFISKLESQYASRLPSGAVFPWNWRFSPPQYSTEKCEVLGRFPYANPHKLVKSLVNIRDCLGMGHIHAPLAEEYAFFVDGAFRVLYGSEIWYRGVESPYNGPVVEHFWSKSFLEFLRKKRKGDELGLPNNCFRRDFSQFFDWMPLATASNCVPISEKWLGKVDIEAVELLSKPSIAAAYQRVVASFRTYIDSQSQAEDVRQLYDDLLKASRHGS